VADRPTALGSVRQWLPFDAASMLDCDRCQAAPTVIARLESVASGEVMEATFCADHANEWAEAVAVVRSWKLDDLRRVDQPT